MSKGENAISMKFMEDANKVQIMKNFIFLLFLNENMSGRQKLKINIIKITKEPNIVPINKSN